MTDTPRPLDAQNAENRRAQVRNGLVVAAPFLAMASVTDKDSPLARVTAWAKVFLILAPLLLANLLAFRYLF